MKLSDFKGEEALDVLADIIEPITYILADEEIQKMQAEENKKREEAIKNKKPFHSAPLICYVKPAIKNHKKEIIQILARLQDQTPEEYEATLSLATLPVQVLEFINDPEIQKLFISQSQTLTEQSASSGSVTENTEAKEN